MSKGGIFWLIWLVCLVFGIWVAWPEAGGTIGFRPIGMTIIQFVLFGLLGWKVFGSPIHD